MALINRLSGEGTTFFRHLAVLSLIGVVAIVTLRLAGEGWEALDTTLLLCLFAVVLSNLSVFGFFGKAR
jgi:hypothetical protein